jgi:hypothetical protein
MSIEIIPIGAALDAEIRGDLAQPLDRGSDQRGLFAASGTGGA